MVHLIIPVLNAPAYTQICLASVREQKDVKPIIVNNGSRQKTSGLISEWTAAAGVKPVVLPMNKGFAGGVNAGLRSLGDELKDDTSVLTMHNDCILFDGCIDEMVAVLRASDDDVAVVMPRTNYANEGTPCVPGLREKFQAVKPSNKERVTVEDINRIVDSVIPDRKAFLADLAGSARLQAGYSPEISSFCMLTRGYFFRKYGMFDEDFWPRGFEDKMWYRNIERDGFVSMIANRAFCWHFGNITSDGPGFSWPDNMRINEEKFKAKCNEKDARMGEVMKAQHPFFEEGKADAGGEPQGQGSV